MMYWLTGGDITRYQAIRRQPLRLAIKWLICRFKEIDDERGFIAACHGAKLKERSGNNRGGLRGLLGMMQSVSKGSAMLQVERVRVSPEELRRRGDKNKGREI